MDAAVKDTTSISLKTIVDRLGDHASERDDIVAFRTDLSNVSLKDLPLKIDALLFIYCDKGGGHISIDLNRYPVTPGSLILIHPRHYISGIESNEQSSLKVFGCAKEAVEDVLPKLTELMPLLLRDSADPVIHLSSSEAEGMLTYYSLLKHILSRRESRFRRQRAVAVLKAALYELMDIRLDKDSDSEAALSRKEEIMARFIIDVSENFRQRREVSYYADKMHVTPKHLSSVVKEMSGRTAGEWIDSYTIMESKVLLKSTDLPIQQITSILNFSNQSFFGKFFKRHTGLSPKAYRNSLA